MLNKLGEMGKYYLRAKGLSDVNGNKSNNILLSTERNLM